MQKNYKITESRLKERSTVIGGGQELRLRVRVRCGKTRRQQQVQILILELSVKLQRK